MGKAKREVKAAAKAVRKQGIKIAASMSEAHAEAAGTPLDLSKRSRNREKLFGGLKTAEEVHGELAFPKDAKCETCQRRPLMRAITMAPVQDAIKQWPEIEQLHPNDLMKRIVTIRENPTAKTGSPYVRIGISYACKSCAPLMEKTLAKLPSWVLVEINRAKPDRFTMGQAGGSHID